MTEPENSGGTVNERTGQGQTSPQRSSLGAEPAPADGAASWGPTPPQRPSLGSLIFGAALIVAGVLLGLGRFGWLPIDSPTDLWPLVLIGIGVSKLWQTWGTPAIGSGAWLVLTGVWFFAVHMRLFGLTLRNSWPLMLIFAGLVMVWRSLLPGRSESHNQEVPNGR